LGVQAAAAREEQLRDRDRFFLLFCFCSLGLLSVLLSFFAIHRSHFVFTLGVIFILS
jgi:hypothetical protein